MPLGKKMSMPFDQTIPLLGICLQTYENINYKNGHCSTAAVVTAMDLREPNVHQ